MIHPEVLFASIYTVFLVAVSQLLRRSAKRIADTAATTEAIPTSGSADPMPDPSWAHGLAAGFRRGLSMIVLAVAAFIILFTAWHFHGANEIFTLGVAAALVASSAASSILSQKTKSSASPA
jgi:hypothetical protein